MIQQIDIFQYIDYRQFLTDALKRKKAANPHFSFRFIAQRLDLRSPGFFNWVLQGKRDLSEHLSHKVASLFGLKKSAWIISFAWFDTTSASPRRRSKISTRRFHSCAGVM